MEIVSVFDEATRDHAAEQHQASLTAAGVEAEEVWPFLALAQSQEEFGHRLALSHEHLTSIAQRHGVSYEEVTASLERGFDIVMEARLPGGDVSHSTKCSNCGHSNPAHSEGSTCECGCNAFQPRTAAKQGSFLGDEIPDDYGQGGNRDPNQVQDYQPQYSSDGHEIMPPGSVRVNHRPDKSGRYDVHQVWDPMASYIVHQGYDIDKAHAAASKAVEEAKTKGCAHARVYAVPGYQGPDKTAARKAAAEYGTPEYDQELRDWSKARENVTYTDGSPVQPGDQIRFHQAPGGLLPHGDWRYGEAVSRPHPYQEGINEMVLRDPENDRHYNLYGHVIERADGSHTSSRRTADVQRQETAGDSHKDEHVPGFTQGNATTPYGQHPYPKGESEGETDTAAHRVEEGWGHQASRDPYAMIRQALLDGQDPLEWIRQQNPAGGTVSHHDQSEQFLGTNPVAYTQAMEQAGTPGQPEIPGGHSDTQQVDHYSAEDEVQQGQGTGQSRHNTTQRTAAKDPLPDHLQEFWGHRTKDPRDDVGFCAKQSRKTPAIPWHNGDPCISCGKSRSDWAPKQSAREALPKG